MEIKLNERNSPAWRIFNLLFDFYIPELALYSEEFLRNNHVNVTGDSEVDTLRINQLTRTRLTVAALTMITMEGYDFGVTKYEDCVQIFSDIQQHLKQWRDQINQYIHPDEFPPLEELRALEAIALTVYQHAMRLSPEKQETSRLFDALVNMNRARNLTTTNKWLAERSTVNGEIKPYVSIVDDIEFYIAENTV